ncbi:hypothetical protein Scep_022027 [Stephania cephalantha]|uniref:Uncharacterized protein n=1 Tax=Stephania cephalantha TaxID=152367 RepID=A0AAP0F9M7_9MAGN
MDEDDEQRLSRRTPAREAVSRRQRGSKQRRSGEREAVTPARSGSDGSGAAATTPAAEAARGTAWSNDAVARCRANRSPTRQQWWTRCRDFDEARRRDRFKWVLDWRPPLKVMVRFTSINLVVTCMT